MKVQDYMKVFEASDPVKIAKGSELLVYGAD